MALPPLRKDHEQSSTLVGFPEIDSHETPRGPHVGFEMQARALPMMLADDPRPDPISLLLQQGQHREALAACAREHGNVLGRLCMALLGSQADADEATQETLLRAHRAMATYRGEGSIKAWLCGIARHVCAHMLETRRKGREIAELAAVPDSGSGRDQLATRQRARAIREALGHLKPSERDVLVLRFVAGLTSREIAIAINLDEAAARKRISRALAHLRTVLPGDSL